MNLDKIPKTGTTITRKRFWDKARDTVMSLQKKEGRNVSVDERQGLGTVINVIRERPAPGTPTGACCVGTDCTIQTLEDCEAMEGSYQGDGTDCDPNPCEETGCDARVEECSPVPTSVDVHIPLQGLTMPSGCIPGDLWHLDIDWDFTLPLDPPSSGFYGCQSFAQIIDTNIGTLTADTPGDPCFGSGIFSAILDIMLILNEGCEWQINARLLPQTYEGLFQAIVSPHGHYPNGDFTLYNGVSPGVPVDFGWPGSTTISIPFDNATTCGGCKHPIITIDFSFS